uniref:Coiled-coil domain-containing protein 13 n=1 Tax=Trypanosoma congolense (strain IL3000) TaxID=1068625 RepID=G0UMR2_TRYCI|nr:conserved hypothetical protein [Trypanosoma congolense IL3000]
MSTGTSCGDSRGGDPIMDEIAELRVLLENDSLTGGILEGKYLNQLRRARQLSVQLESERTRGRQLEEQLRALKTELQKNGAQSSDEGSKEARRRPAARGTTSEADEEQQNLTNLRERLDRAFVQLSDAKVQLEEQKKEAQRLRKIVQQEVGGSPQDIEALLKAAPGGTGGWRGRAQQIVLLKSKVKELERAVAAAGESGRTSSQSNTARGGASSISADTATASTQCRDMDDIARERVVDMQSRRLMQTRELQEELTRRTAELESMKQRLSASQSRHTILENDNRQLRENLQVVLQKTENDNDLIDAYREEIAELQHTKLELHEAKAELGRWEKWCSSINAQNPRGSVNPGSLNRSNANGSQDALRCADDGNGEIDVNTAVALAGADTAIELNRLRLENLELKTTLMRNGHCTGESGLVEGKEDRARDDMALLIHWLKSFVSSGSAEGGDASSASAGVVWQERVAEVLRRSHAAVVFSEKQQQGRDAKLSKCYETIQQLQAELNGLRDGKPRKGTKTKQDHNDDKVSGNDFSAIDDILVQENASLKHRIRVMQELSDKERAAYESLRHELTPAVSNDAVTIASYQKLKHEYDELRNAFNALQAERLSAGTS